MATSGSKTVAVTSYNNLVFSWSASGQSVANNTTTIAWTLKLVASANGKISSSASKSWEVTINGVAYSGTNTVGISSNATKVLASGSAVIKHNSDGSKSFDYNFSQQFDITFGGSNIGTIHGSGYGTLNTIPRASTLTVANSTLGTEQTLTINKADNSFLHRITFNCGDIAGYILGSTTEKSAVTSVGWKPQLAFATTNVNGTTVSVKLTLWTYDGDGNHIGNTVKTITCAIPASIKPSCSITVTDPTGISDIYGNPVKGLSKFAVTVTPVLAYQSPIAAYGTTVDGTKYKTATFTTGLLKSSGAMTILAVVQDNRGRSGSDTVHKTVLDYSAPSITKLTVKRCDADGTENDQGEHVQVTFTAAVTALDNKNKAEYTLRYKKATETSYTSVALSALTGNYTVTDQTYIFPADSGSSYDVELSVVDNHNTVTRSTSASTGFTMLHFHADGTGLGVGKVSEKPNTMEVGLNTEFSGNMVQMGNRYSSFIPEDNPNAAQNGFDLMARITVIGAYANAPISFTFTRRGMTMPMVVHVCLGNTADLNPGVVSFRYEGVNYGAYLVKSSDSVWDLYVGRGGEYDFLTLQGWETSQYMDSRVNVTFPRTFAGALPSGWVGAAPSVVQSVFEFMYPVGTILHRYDHTNPAALFGFGTWERLTSVILRGATASGTIGETGTLADGSGRTYMNVSIWRRTG